MKYLMIVMVTILSANFASARINITSKASDEVVPLYSVSGVIVEYEHVDQFEPLNAYIILKMTGKLEANICPNNDYSMLTDHLGADSLTGVDHFDIKIVPSTLGSGDIEIGEEFCTLQSQPEWFSVTMRWSIISWDPAKTVQMWEYSIRDSNKAYGKMNLTYHKRKGWSINFTKI